MNASAPLNLCRDLIAQASSSPGLWAAAQLCRDAQKFSLPEGGRVLTDPTLRGLEETLPLRLPFPIIALEYLATRENFAPGMSEPCRRRIVLAIEEANAIAITPIFRFDDSSAWIALPPCLLPKEGYIGSRQGGTAGILMKFPSGVAQADYYDEVSALLMFLNALQCSNVHIEQQPARKPAKKASNALPFDSYHALVVDVPRTRGQHGDAPSQGDRREVREHLRRGHIVRPTSGRPYWRNATVVNAGKSLATITKDYVMRPAA